MNSRLQWFTIRLSIPHLAADQARALVPDLQEELDLRPHLRAPQVTQQPDSGVIIVEVDTEALNAEQAATGMAEELFEATCAVLEDTASLRVEILEMQPSAA